MSHILRYTNLSVLLTINGFSEKKKTHVSVKLLFYYSLHSESKIMIDNCN